MDESISYVIGDSLPGPFRTLWGRFEEVVAEYPETTALVVRHQPADLYGLPGIALETEEYAKFRYLRLSYRQLHNTVNRLTRSLSAQGVVAGTPIFTFLPNGLEYTTIFWAASALGCILVPINIRNLAKAAEVAHLIQTAFKGCASASAVVFTDGPDTAARLDNFPEFENALKVVTADSEWEGWRTFGAMLTGGAPADDSFIPTPVADEHRDRTILFTSGTTSFPKGVHNNFSYLMTWRDAAGQSMAAKHGDVLASAMPNNHAMASVCIYMVQAFGGTLVLAGPYFEPVTFLEALRAESCTLTVMVPTMLYALVLAKTNGRIDAPSLEKIVLGGTAVTPQVIRMAVEELGANKIEHVFGMTEGVVLGSGAKPAEEICHGDHVTVGRCNAGGRIKVCHPDTTEPVPRGQPGELHVAAPSVQASYIGAPTDDAFYEEDGLRWLATGDQAVLEADGRLYIVGRYKEMIIRGGENIAPAAVEACINRELPQLKHLQVQVVGVVDEFAGEVPVAVVTKPVDAQAAQLIKDAVTTSMGKIYALDDVMSLTQLGLADYPRTMGGKIQKKRLTDLVRGYREEVEANIKRTAESGLSKQVIHIWARLAGLDAADLSSSTALAELGDSITLMRVKDRLYKEAGINMTVQEMLEARTLGNLIHIMQSSAPVNVDGALARFQPPDHPPTIDDLVHAVGDSDVFEATKLVISNAIGPHGLSWNDVRHVMPAYDFTDLKARDGTLERWSFKSAFVTSKHTVQELRTAMVKMLANNPMQSSFMVFDDEVLGNDLLIQFTVDQKPEWLNGLIEDKGTLATVASLKSIAMDMRAHTMSEYPGPLARVHLYFIEETQCAGAVLNIHHAVTDASFAQLILEDLDLALTGNALKAHVPYKLYCDNVYNLGNSPAARAATKYHVHKLKDLARHKAHMFPPPGRAVNIQDDDPDGYTHTFSATAVQKLIYSQPHLAPSVVMKAAMVLFLLHQTRHTHAMFGSFESCRDRFPFLDKATAAAAHLEASDVGGQLIQPVMNLVPLECDRGETVIDFLSRMQAEQVLQTKHASAPWRQIMRGLGGDSGLMFPQQTTHCIYNWLGSTDARYANVQIVDAFLARDAVPFSMNTSFVRDKAGDRIKMQLRGSTFHVEELRVFALELQSAAQWLAEGANWQRRVGAFEEAFLTM